MEAKLVYRYSQYWTQYCFAFILRCGFQFTLRENNYGLIIISNYFSIKIFGVNWYVLILLSVLNHNILLYSSPFAIYKRWDGTKLCDCDEVHWNVSTNNKKNHPRIKKRISVLKWIIKIFKSDFIMKQISLEWLWKSQCPRNKIVLMGLHEEHFVYLHIFSLFLLCTEAQYKFELSD
jgi:hypothetical protein